jgi:hypothetical protein
VAGAVGRVAALGLVAVSCSRPVQIEGPVSSPSVMTVVGTLDSAVRVMNGGYGSAVALDPRDPTVVFLLTDRGPNVDGSLRGQKLFPVPDYAPRIGRFRVKGGVLVLEDTMVLRARDGARLSGLPQPPGPGSTREQAAGLDGELLGRGGYDRNGFDLEGLARMPDGSFWVSDEYGPYLLHVDASGRELARVSPFGGERPLPAVLARRRPNCGMEGLAALPDGVTLAGVMQCGLDNPSASTPGIRRSRLTRVVLYDTRTGESRQFAHLLEHADHLSSDIAALDAHRFLIIERDLRWPAEPHAFKQIHLVDIRDASDVTGDPAAPAGLVIEEKTLEELAAGVEDPAPILERHGVRVTAKRVAADLITDLPGWSHDKPEGVAVLNDSTLLISNDDDFGIAGSHPPGRVVQKKNPVTGQVDYGELRQLRFR